MDQGDAHVAAISSAQLRNEIGQRHIVHVDQQGRAGTGEIGQGGISGTIPQRAGRNDDGALADPGQIEGSLQTR